MILKRLNKADGTWLAFEASWLDECKQRSEDFGSYYQSSLGVLRDECDDGAINHGTGVFALVDDDGRHHAICFLNSTFLPGYEGRVLRVRHLVLSPYYDFEALELEDYASILAHYFLALLLCSEDTLPSPHIKIHYRSPYDRTFFAAFGMTLRSLGRLGTVESKGMWLHLTKAK